MKEMLRPARDALIALFSRDVAGQHHWKIPRWRKEAQIFAQKYGLELTAEQLNGLIILLYSAFGASAKRFLIKMGNAKQTGKKAG